VCVCVLYVVSVIFSSIKNSIFCDRVSTLLSAILQNCVKID